MAESAVAADPSNRSAQRRLAAACLNIADALTLTDLGEAARYYKRMIGIMDRMSQDDPGNLISGEIHLALGEDRAALTAMQAAYERARQLSDAHPADNACFSVLADTLRSLGHLYETSRAFRNLETARGFYSREVEIWRKWPTRTTTSAYDRGRLREARAAVDRVGRR